jgi:GNAT superfamily N-acetyltransferase
MDLDAMGSALRPSLAEIKEALRLDGGVAFRVPDIDEFATKLMDRASFVQIREGAAAKLASFVAFYSNGPKNYVTVVWTDPEYRGKGLAESLLRSVVDSNGKATALEVQEKNQAQRMYRRLGFLEVSRSGGAIRMLRPRRVAIMQPYVFPYVGYFNLIDAVDLFVFLDDVAFPKRGWVNRNRLLVNGMEYMFTVPVQSVSQNRLICETRIAPLGKWLASFLKTLRYSYGSAVDFDLVEALVRRPFESGLESISAVAQESVVSVMEYLALPFDSVLASQVAPRSVDLVGQSRIVDIACSVNAVEYYNPPGGRGLYDSSAFESRGLELRFVIPRLSPYAQAGGVFLPGLSIIDMLMRCSRATARGLTKDYDIAK